MEKKIFIDASQAKQTRIAILNDGQVDEYEFENEDKKQLKGNIYLGKISRVEPSLQAAFVDFGNERHGFLAFNDIQAEYYQIPNSDKEDLLKEEEKIREELNQESQKLDHQLSDSEQEVDDLAISNDIDLDDELDIENTIQNNQEISNGKNESEETLNGNTEEAVKDVNHSDQKILQNKVDTIRNKRKKYRIQEVIKPGQVVLIQIVKEERGNKGASLTTFLSLAGKYIVLMPNTAKGGGISRKIFNYQDRKHIREVINSLNIPSSMGLIVRTAGANKTLGQIKNDLDVLVNVWETIKEKTINSNAPCLIHEEGDLIYRVIRDFLTSEIDEILIDGEDGYEKAKKNVEIIAKEETSKIKKYKGKVPLFYSCGIEKYLNSIFEPRVDLKSGGYLIINPTEALIAIDINSGKSTKERNVEKTALATNIEAAIEIARQIKIRDLAGLIVIDFIDMENFSNRRLVERKMKEAVRADKARIQVGRISHFGLLEMTRQRLRESSVKWEITLSPESFCQKILKTIEAKLFEIQKVKKVSVQTSKKIKEYLNQYMMDEVKYFESRFKFRFIFNINNDLLSNEFVIEFLDNRNKVLSDYKDFKIKTENIKEEENLNNYKKKQFNKRYKPKKFKKYKKENTETKEENKKEVA